MFGRLKLASDSKLDSDDIDLKLDKLLVSATSFPEHDREAEDVVFVKVKRSAQGRRPSLMSGDDQSHHTDDTQSLHSKEGGGEYTHLEAPYIFYEKKPQPIEIKEVAIDSLPMYENHPEHKLTIVHMSDSHKSHQFLKNIPDGDIFIHSGGISHKSEWRELHNVDKQEKQDHYHRHEDEEPLVAPSIRSFNEWIGKLPHPIKIVVCGNHDMGMDELGAEYIQKHVLTNATYLQDQQLVVKYKDVDFLRIFGIPWTATNAHSSGTAFTLKKDKLDEKWEQIPKDTEILVTHSPPFGIMDLATCSGPDYYCEYCGKQHKYKRHLGCTNLRNKTIQLNQQGSLRAHFFGHVRDYHGTTFEAITQHTPKSLIYSNASSVMNHSDPRIRSPIVVELKLS